MSTLGFLITLNLNLKSTFSYIPDTSSQTEENSDPCQWIAKEPTAPMSISRDQWSRRSHLVLSTPARVTEHGKRHQRPILPRLGGCIPDSREQVPTILEPRLTPH